MNSVKATFLVLLAAFFAGCGGAGGNSPSQPTVTISPSSVTLYASQTQQFQASVSGISSQSVTWSASAGSISLADSIPLPPLVAGIRSRHLVSCRCTSESMHSLPVFGVKEGLHYKKLPATEYCTGGYFAGTTTWDSLRNGQRVAYHWMTLMH
jgi:hypothetical protein